MSKKILITGGNGSIGRQISNYLSKRNEVYILDKVKLKKNKKINQFKVNLNNFNNVKKILDKILKDKKNIDVIINCVGNINNYPVISFDQTKERNKCFGFIT